MNLLTAGQLAAIRQRNDARTQGEWEKDADATGFWNSVFCTTKVYGGGHNVATFHGDSAEVEANAEFAARASTDIPALLAHIEAQREEIEKRNELLRELGRRVLQHKRGCNAKYADAPEWYTGVVATPCTCDWDALRKRIQEAVE